ncbi:hypothetical protein PIIN_01353 [Serendipita indica DSM 11827]|uniref:Tyrosine specific protein phosphatases domain-containing protein n=1 Tax=Serendipita indica (strain DSM 11827) TaxID=1109443 RepID=G4T865_SERID|nr:hypothetical protein PIIN_01353 [Serendipita indica DSM 11827]
MYDIETIAKTPINDIIDPEIVKDIITNPPFVVVDGVVNTRDLGGLSITSPPTDRLLELSKSGSRLVVRSGKLFRSAGLNAIRPKGIKTLNELNIGTVFDLRSIAEVREYAGLPEVDSPDPREGLPLFLEEPENGGIQVTHVPLVDIVRLGREEKMAILLKYGEGEGAYARAYEEILTDGKKSFGSILRYIADQAKGQEGKACLWNCHVGKDRTGVFSALMLSLLGVSDEDIARDYSLTRIGLEPIRGILVEQFKGFMTAHPKAAASLASSDTSSMHEFLHLLRTKYGGSRAYFVKQVGFTDGELDMICEQLIVATSP